MNPTETQITNAIMGFLRYKGYYVQRMNSGAIRDYRNVPIRMNKAGTPDIMAFKEIDRSFDDKTFEKIIDLVFVEVKRPGKKPTILQEQVMKELEEYGARCFVAHSVEDVEKELS